MRLLLAILTHGLAVAIGFAGGIYALPILIAPAAPSAAEVGAVSAQALFKARFTRDLRGSDALHWGEGEVSLSRSAVSLDGELAPGPDYRLYLSPEFVEDEAGFIAARSRMVEVGPVKTFSNFVVAVPPSIDPAAYTTVVVWCETFGEFITAARYR